METYADATNGRDPASNGPKSKSDGVRVGVGMAAGLDSVARGELGTAACTRRSAGAVLTPTLRVSPATRTTSAQWILNRSTCTGTEWGRSLPVGRGFRCGGARRHRDDRSGPVANSPSAWKPSPENVPPAGTLWT